MQPAMLLPPRPAGTLFLGLAFGALGYFFFALNDAMAKALLADYSLAIVLLVRSIAALLFVAPLVAKRGLKASFKSTCPRLCLIRTICLTIEVSFFYAAVVYIPLAEALSLYMSAPIIVAVLSYFLGDKPTRAQWATILTGFLGVLIVLEPGTAMFNWPSLLALFSSSAFAVSIVVTHHMKDESNLTMILWQFIAVAVTGLLLGPDLGELQDYTGMFRIGLLGLVSMLGYHLLNKAVRMTSPSIVAPMQYTLLLHATIFGVLFFNEMPTTTTLVGALLIICSSAFLSKRSS
ncbi:DMT family transporter [Pseudovibrio flavus]|uniref:DMT family transporter n=1 Tax=Pseudovibrio flavus TaxID=2529854 RepID=UPI00211CE702|nr:DMT family transporter [Pseudovibrio flavus]